MKIRYTLCGLVVFFSANANAVESAEFIPLRLKTYYYSEMVTIIPPSGHTITNPNSCTDTSGYALDPTNFGGGGHGERFSLAMGAILNSKNISVEVAGCSTTTNQPLVTRVTLIR